MSHEVRKLGMKVLTDEKRRKLYNA